MRGKNKKRKEKLNVKTYLRKLSSSLAPPCFPQHAHPLGQPQKRVPQRKAPIQRAEI